MQAFSLEDLKAAVSTFSPVQCDFLTENCIVALEDHGHTRQCPLKVSGDKEQEFAISWSKEVNKAGYKEKKKIIEHGAEAISFLLSVNLTNYTVVEEALIGTGVDYWLGYDEGHANYNPKNFLQARLEISGIDKETPGNTLEKRTAIKKKQTEASDNTSLPAYVSIIEFSSPKAFFGKK